MALAKDIMTKKPLIAGSGSEIKDIVELFSEHRITTVPVESPVGEILGLLTEMNLLKAMVTGSAIKKLNKVIHFQDQFEQIFYVHEEDSITLVMKSIMQSPSHRVVVLNNAEKIVGIISPKDLIQSIGGEEKIEGTVMDEVRNLNKEVDDLKLELHDMKSYLEIYDNVFQSGIYMLHSVNKEGVIILANEKLHNVLK